MQQLKKILFYFLLLLLSGLMIASAVSTGEVMPLRGAVERVDRPVFSWQDWFSGSYQLAMDDRTKHKFALRSVFIRIKNQMDYTFFDEIHARNVVEGKSNYLYEQNYIDAYLGKDFIGEERIIQKVEKLKFLQDTLAALDKTLVVALAAGKASYYPEYIPSEYDDYPRTKTNYQAYAEQLALQGVNHIDYNKWFLEMKDTATYSLYPRSGIHWSSYGEKYVADSLLRYLEKERQIDLPDIIYTSMDFHSPPILRDKDLEDGMNLLFAIDESEMAYPQFYYEKEGKDSANLLVVADSYYWGLENMGFSRAIFKEAHFWFYNNEFFPSNGKSNSVAMLDIKEETLKRDVILLMATEATIGGFAWSYIEGLHNAFLDKDYENTKMQKQINHIVSTIKQDAKWYQHVQEKAKHKNITIDSMLWLDAKYMYDRGYEQ